MLILLRLLSRPPGARLSRLRRQPLYILLRCFLLDELYEQLRDGYAQFLRDCFCKALLDCGQTNSDVLGSPVFQWYKFWQVTS